MGNSEGFCRCLNKEIEKNHEKSLGYQLGNYNRSMTNSKNVKFSLPSSEIASGDGLNQLSQILKQSTNETAIIKNYSFKKEKVSNSSLIKFQAVVRGVLFRKHFVKPIKPIKPVIKKVNKKNELILNNDSELIEGFIPEKTKKLIKLFEQPLDLENGWKEYLGENNSLMESYINNLKAIKNNENLKYTQGLISYYKNEKCLYIGQLKGNNIFEGTGQLYFRDGRFIEGIFKDGEINGLGRYIDDKENCFEGIFYDGIIKGKGLIIKLIDSIDDKPNIIKYEGDIKDYKKEGIGKEISNEYIYEGSFSNNFKHGKGKLVFVVSKDEFEGDFQNGVITGFGKYNWNNKHSYVGELFDGKMHGKGIYKWPDGSSYNGEYINGIKSGNGEFTWKDGKIFKGNFSDGKPNGKGILTYHGKSVNAEFVNGKLQGNLKDIFKSAKSVAE